MSLRMEKVNKELRKQIMGIIQEEVDNPALAFLSITRVETTKDLQESKVYFSILDEIRLNDAKEALDSMRGLLRHILGKRVRLKVLPQLNFIPDDSMKYSVDIYKRIEEIKDAQELDKKDSGKDK